MPTTRRLVPLILVAVVGVPSLARAEFDPKEYSYKKGKSCVPSAAVDPFGVVFYGTAATPGVLFDNGPGARGDVRKHTGWAYHSADSIYYQESLANGTCHRNDDADLASAFPVPNSRFHVRFWETGGPDPRGRWYMVTTPHHEDWVPWPSCNKPPIGSHAVDKGAVNRGPDYRTPNGSGFDQGRRELVQAYDGKRHHAVSYESWGNTHSVMQCDGDYAGSNGVVAYITVGRT
jgi:hypothetical protein